MIAATARPAGGARRLLRVTVLDADPLALLVNIVAAAFIAGFVLAAIFRLGYAYALQVTEPATIVEVERILRGQSIYVEPTLRYIPMIYGPIYFYIAAAFA